jgi:ABC-type multidrug transport system ATPase subunit
VDNVSLGFGRNQVFALLGPNGAGKSSAMKIITGDLEATFGSVSIGVNDDASIG